MADESTRPIRCDYYDNKAIVKRTSSKWAHTAVPNIIKHLQWGDWDATHAEVYDTSRQYLLLAVVRTYLSHGKRKLEILYEHQGTKEINSEKE